MMRLEFDCDDNNYNTTRAIVLHSSSLFEVETCLYLLPWVHHPLHCGLLGYLGQSEVGIDVDVNVCNFGSSLFRLLVLLLFPLLRFWRLDCSMLVVHLKFFTILLKYLLVNFEAKVT